MNPEIDCSVDSKVISKVERNCTEDSLAAESQDNLNYALDKKLDRKFDLHIVPWLFGIQ